MTAIPNIKTPFSNLQMEILRLFAEDVPEYDLLEIKKMIAKYFFDKAAKEAERVWQERGYDDAFLQKIIMGEI
jgi:hypothetical protein